MITSFSQTAAPAFLRGIFLALFVLGSSEARAGFYGGIDAGTSFAPHGVGALAGWHWGDLLWLEAGAGYSKHGAAGVPFSLELKIKSFRGDGYIFYVAPGLTHYRGEGRVDVAHEGDSGDYVVETQAKWDITYARWGAVTGPVVSWPLAL